MSTKKIDYQVFASEAKTGELTEFPNIARGWGVTLDQTAGKPPLEWFNGIQKRTDEWLLHLTREGIAEWDSTIDYTKDAVVKYNSLFYVAIRNNKGDAPDRAQASWKSFFEEINSAIKKAYDLADSANKTANTNATTSEKGQVQLSSATNSTSETLAATSKAVKSAYDLASTAKTDAAKAQAKADNAVVVGEFKLFPFRKDELPAGWYFANGDKYLLTSAQGGVLQSLPLSYKTDWNIVEADGYINLPSYFYSDGRGVFPRPVDGTSRHVGSVVGDAIRNIVGTIRDISHGAYAPLTSDGVFNYASTENVGNANSLGLTNVVTFDASRVVPTSTENKPLDVGMTPAIYLGV